jgi:hypothetical protein
VHRLSGRGVQGRVDREELVVGRGRGAIRLLDIGHNADETGGGADVLSVSHRHMAEKGGAVGRTVFDLDPLNGQSQDVGLQPPPERDPCASARTFGAWNPVSAGLPVRC